MGESGISGETDFGILLHMPVRDIVSGLRYAFKAGVGCFQPALFVCRPDSVTNLFPVSSNKQRG